MQGFPLKESWDPLAKHPLCPVVGEVRMLYGGKGVVGSCT